MIDVDEIIITVVSFSLGETLRRDYKFSDEKVKHFYKCMTKRFLKNLKVAIEARNKNYGRK